MSLESTLLQHGVPARYAKAARSMIAYGTEGAVYDLGGGRVLKVNVTARHQSITHLVKRERGRSWGVKIYDWGRLHPGGDGRGAKGAPSARGFWYTMPRLIPLDRREQRLLNALGLAIMATAKGHLTKTALHRKELEILPMLPPPLARVVTAARKAGYHDVHGRNVMQTTSGAYKFVDLESLRPAKRK